MKLLSHGKNSNLLEHLREVMLAAECPDERIICAVHDIGKATGRWQEYIREKSRGKKADSPHTHAAEGALLGAFIISLLKRADSELWTLVALHAGAAHHSALCELGAASYWEISSDAQAKDFFLDGKEGVASLLPEIPHEILVRAWEMFSDTKGKSIGTLLSDIAMSEDQDLRVNAFFKARGLLGRLCFQDHQSAAKQSGGQNPILEWKSTIEAKEFKARPPRVFNSAKTRLNKLRTELKNEFTKCVEKDSAFYFIDAPTGLGKTECMLSAAEILRRRCGLDKIIFAVPQVSIADQIFEEYFKGNHPDAQIWNYRRKESTAVEKSQKRSESESDNNDSAFAYELIQTPFVCSYNITTFNQVLLSAFHPLRERCIRGLTLRNAVIIMDEFHKLPFIILPYFFRLTKRFALINNCRFIFGSATPMDSSDYLGLESVVQLPKETSAEIYGAPEIDSRREYVSLGELTVEKVIDLIKSFHTESEENLLVVLNLIGKGTWKLHEHFRDSYNPWQQLDDLDSDSKERATVFLDGLVPPALRRDIVVKCKALMRSRKRPVTLITTQMVEVGVDLDFDRAMIDYQGIAATIQRGGRVGREGSANSCRKVEVFQLMVESQSGGTAMMQSSFDTLMEIQKKNDHRFSPGFGAFKDFASAQNDFWNKEKFFFRKWTTVMKDSELNGKLLEIQKRVFKSADMPENLFCKLFKCFDQDCGFGLTLEHSQWIAELFTEDSTGACAEYLILKDNDVYTEFRRLLDGYISGKSSDETKHSLFSMISDYKIRVYDPRIREVLDLSVEAVTDQPEKLKIVVLEKGVIM